MPGIKPDYVKDCIAKNAPTGEGLKAAEAAAKKVKEEVGKLADEAYKAAHDVIAKTEDTSADKLAEAYRAAHGIM